LVVEQPIYSTGSCQFAIVTIDDKHIGNSSYFNVDSVNHQAEIGIMIGEKEYWDQGYGAEAMLITLNYIFRHTDLNRIHLKTLDWNIRAQKCFTKCGFKTCGNLGRGEYNFIIMEIYRQGKTH
jgi:RimJ/RimL family protein N-acetyltransferase